jgi:hypothetical protein
MEKLAREGGMISYRINRFKVMAVAGVLFAVGSGSLQGDNFGHTSHMGFDLVGQAKAAEPKRSFIDAQAVRLMRQMGRYLGAAREFSFRADITHDEVFMGAHKLQYAGIANVAVSRPDKLHVRYSGEERQTRVFYDGKTFTILDPVKMVYTRTKVPPTIDAAIDKIFAQYGFSVPIADFVYEDPYRVLMENVESGFVVGRTWVQGRPVFHLAFTQKEIDWQIWIEDGPTPLPRKLLITHKNEPGSPQYTAILSGWDLKTRLSESFAEFSPPVGSDKIQFMKVTNSPARN